MTHVCGVYRAVVVHNTDPLGLGRVQVKCPQLFGSEALTDWMICTIPAGSYSTVPAAGTQGYIGFEAGDVDHPVWIGNTSVFPTPPTRKLLDGTEVQGNLVVDGAITVSTGGSNIAGPLTAGSLDVTNNAYVAGYLGILGPVIAEANVYVTGAIAVSTTGSSFVGTTTLEILNVTGNTTLANLNVSGATTVNTIISAGPCTLEAITVSGVSSLSTVTVSGNTTLAELTVSGGNTTLAELSSSGPVALASVNVSGASSLATLGVSGASTLASLSVTGSGSIGTTFGVSGLLFALGGITVNAHQINSLAAGSVGTDAVNLQQMNSAINAAIPPAAPQVHTKAWQTGAWTPNIGGTTQLVLDSLVYAVGAGFNTSSFTAPYTGFYHVSGAVGVTTSSATASTIQMLVYVNGSPVMYGAIGSVVAASGIAMSSTVSGTVSLNVNDAITLYYYIYTGTASGLTTASTYVTIDKVN